MLTIHQATPSDAPALAALNAAFNDVYDPAETIAQRMAGAGHVETAFIALVDGETAGFVCVRIAPCLLYAQPHAELTELFVLPKFRWRGVAGALAKHAEQLARERGAESLIVLTSDEKALAFYKAIGYTQTSTCFEKEL
ncbi:MAG TPA: GNAT family N-acetyltransferase [Thermoflexales bacterium]|nr:GNAT family N-acetyltransferase [Thermoflexales bacterium]HQW34068.1 GNAT family N-acetyltransferase [Thermoflexales bacterium]HQX75486.1 GNAT family N-acetyltransferase [Thermoflexales bacterium]HQZ22461.1 GNAT family N-acetyltransferase [Thermoflexales bacterium]